MHQLHCVDSARSRYNDIVYNNATPLSGKPLDENWIEHLEHCFEYLRLSIMCADYMTLESDSPPGSPKEYSEGGLSWGVVHSCIDWDALKEFQHSQVVLYNSTWDGGESLKREEERLRRIKMGEGQAEGSEGHAHSHIHTVG